MNSFSSKQLRWPFEKHSLCICIVDRVWYFPHSVDSSLFRFDGWQSESLFGNNNPVHIEFCSGNGQWIAEKARCYPNLNWLAVEKRWDRASKIWAKIKRGNLGNLVVAWADANDLIRSFLPDDSVDAIYVNFPDPWPKRRHANNRLINPSFVLELHRILKLQGNATIVTDDMEYSKGVIHYFTRCKGFGSKIQAPFWQKPPEDYGTSYFETLFRSQGKTIHYHSFIKESIFQIPSGEVIDVARKRAC